MKNVRVSKSSPDSTAPKDLSDYIYADENQVVNELLETLSWDDKRAKAVHKAAVKLVEKTRSQKQQVGQIESFLQKFPLTSNEGLSLMSLAEALLRIPDSATADALIQDKIAAADWLMGAAESASDDSDASSDDASERKTKKKSGNWLTKAAGFGLSMTQKTLSGRLSGLGKPIIREAIIRSIRVLGKQFVLGQTIEDALKRAKDFEKKGYRFSFDMLGEGARTSKDADRYFEAYALAIEDIGQSKAADASKNTRMPGISVKLSALYPRYEYAHKDFCVPALADKLYTLCEKAAANHMALTVDAEEVDRLELSLDIIESVLERGLPTDETGRSWSGLGLAVQAYQKRAIPAIDRIASMAKTHGVKMRIRLVKGAYWDTEIKRAQVMGLPDYPVFTRKQNTDISYLTCVQRLFEHSDVIFPMFATHNAHTITAVLEMAQESGKPYELQRLHGMGEGIYNALQDLMEKEKRDVPLTIYAPVGSHEDLLPYLVRRLLENGANSSFVNKLLDPSVPPAEMTADPLEVVRAQDNARHPAIVMPSEIFLSEGEYPRLNSSGFDHSEATHLAPILETIQNFTSTTEIASIIDGAHFGGGQIKDITNPADINDIVARVEQAEESDVEEAFKIAQKAYESWSTTDAEERAEALEKFASLLEANALEFIAILSREAGKTIEDARDEIREAVDFARYYANRGREDFSKDGLELPGPTGESNRLYMNGRGVFVCISPWNFPLAIFSGQILAALMAGNCVIAKPADQTPLVAYRAVQLMHEAGIPAQMLNLVFGRGSVIGNALTSHPLTAGVAFTGSTDVAYKINIALAQKAMETKTPIVPLIAETGGQNAMIVDSSALPEQVIDDVVLSAFGSAGQRCSALRILCVQDVIADKVITMLKGAMQELHVGNPAKLATDVGPVIDSAAQQELEDHIKYMDKNATLIARADLNFAEHSRADKQNGSFFAPAAYEIDDISILKGEVFGPILHVLRYNSEDTNALVKALNDTGYGLTFGIHSRIETVQNALAHSLKVGNVYINRSMTGAVVGVQPFGGQGLSGTGPKAGGPHYLHRFATEKTVTINTTAAGGNASLVCL